jgi:hypothetical protein
LRDERLHGRRRADGGDWREIEVLGPSVGQAIVKVRANAATLTTIAVEHGFERIPAALLKDPISSLKVPASTVRQMLLDAGYTVAEITTRFGSSLDTFAVGSLLLLPMWRLSTPVHTARL